MFKNDLEDRTIQLSVSVIRICKEINKSVINTNIISQLLKSSSSIGANYREANEAYSDKEFKQKLSYCRKESKETVYWLRLLIECNPELTKELELLIDEAKQLLRIFASILTKKK